MMKKILRILSYIALVIVCGNFLLNIANSVRYSIGKPDDSESFNYSGEWESNSLPVSGKLLAEIPYPLPINEPFKVKAIVYYNMTSLYRTGQFVPMELDGHIQESGETAGSNSETPVDLPSTISFKSSGGLGGKQEITYVSTSDNMHLHFSGGYLSVSPNDIGVFSLNKIN